MTDPILSFTKCNVIVLTGGGSAGAMQVGFLKRYLESIHKSPEIDLITGVSAGALNGAVLSYFKNDFENGLKYLENQWKTIRNDSIYKVELSNILSLKSLLDTSPERELVSKNIN